MSDSTGATGATGEAAESSPRLAIPLASGGKLDIWSDRITVGAELYPLHDITWAGLVAAPPAPVPQGMPPAPPLPAIALRMRDQCAPVFVPADPSNAWRLLETLFALRPDLCIPPPVGAPGSSMGIGGAYQSWAPPPPPPPRYGYWYGSYGAAAGGIPPYYPLRSNTNDTVLAGISHLSTFFAPVILPLIVWLTTQRSSPYASRQAKQAFFFQLLISVLDLVIIVLFYVFFIFSVINAAPASPDQSPRLFFGAFGAFWLALPVVFAIGIINFVFSIIGAVQAFQGKPFHYPLLGRL